MSKTVVEPPGEARAELALAVTRLNVLIRGIALGMGLKGKWAFDAELMAYEVEEPDEPEHV